MEYYSYNSREKKVNVEKNLCTLTFSIKHAQIRLGDVFGFYTTDLECYTAATNYYRIQARINSINKH